MSESKAEAHVTAHTVLILDSFPCCLNGMVTPDVIVRNHDSAEIHVFSDEEMLALGEMTDRLEALDEAIRVRPNAMAIAALRERVEFGMDHDGDPEDRLADHCAGVLLDMLAKIEAVPK